MGKFKPYLLRKYKLIITFFFSHLKASRGKKEPILSEVTEHKQAIIAVPLGIRFYQ